MRSGNVIVQNTRILLAPRVRAICSRRGLISSKAIRVERTSSGNDITPNAISTARQVKTISRCACFCRKPPSGPLRPNSLSRIKPVATGGITRGKVTSVSTKDLPGHRRRASTQATAIPAAG